MEEQLGEALSGFDAALAQFRSQLADFPDLSAAVFNNTGGWRDLLRYKLVPHLGGNGCLVASIAGGTNTGKSTIFNVLLQEEVSPVRTTAAATCRPVLAGNERRYEECRAGMLVPEFSPRPLDNPDLVVSRETAPTALFVARADSLPDELVLLDTPDVDSIDRENWVVADQIRAAGDVMVAVLTAEKYQDDRVVAFFRKAHDSGRIVLPLMNKADPADKYAVAREQLGEFCEAVGIEDAISFVVPHDFNLAEDFLEEEIHSLDGEFNLRDFLESLDVAALKEDVYSETIEHFTKEASAFLKRTGKTGAFLREITAEFEARAEAAAEQYDPQPDARVGELLHEFIKVRRGFFGRGFGKITETVAKGLSPLRRAASSAWKKRATLGQAEKPLTEHQIHDKAEQELEVIARNLLIGYTESAGNLRQPAARLVSEALAGMDVDAAVRAAVADTLAAESVTESFRNHANKMLESWWTEHKVMRNVLQQLDALLVITPTALAVPLSFYTAGVGVPEATAVAGIVGGEFFAQVLMHQFSDQWMDLLRPWRREQRDTFRAALDTQVVAPALARMRDALAPFEGEAFEAMGRNLDLCRKAS